MPGVASINPTDLLPPPALDRKEPGDGSFSSLLDATAPQDPPSAQPASAPPTPSDSSPPANGKASGGEDRAPEADADETKNPQRKHARHAGRNGTKIEDKQSGKDPEKPEVQDGTDGAAPLAVTVDAAVTPPGMSVAAAVTAGPNGDANGKMPANGNGAETDLQIEVGAAAPNPAGANPAALVASAAPAIPAVAVPPDGKLPAPASPVGKADVPLAGTGIPTADDSGAALKDTAEADASDASKLPRGSAIAALTEKASPQAAKVAAVIDLGERPSTGKPSSDPTPPGAANIDPGESTAEPAEALPVAAKAAADAATPASLHDAGAAHEAAPPQPPTQPVSLPDSLRLFSSSLTPSPQAQAPVSAGQPIPPTAAALAIEIAARVKEGSHQFDIRLDPPELGRIDVRLDVGKGGEVNTRLTVDRPETLQLLQNDARGLERALQSAGLKTDDGSLQFSLRQQSPDGSGGQQAQTGPDSRAPAFMNEDEPVSAGLEQYQWAAQLRGGVDIRI